MQVHGLSQVTSRGWTPWEANCYKHNTKVSNGLSTVHDGHFVALGINN